MHLLPEHVSPTKQRDEKANETLCYLNSVARADQALKLDALRGKIAVVVVIAHLLEEAFDVAVVDGNDQLRRYRLGELRRRDLGGPGCRNHQRQGLDTPEGRRQESERVARIEEAIVDDIGGVLWQRGGKDFLVVGWHSADRKVLALIAPLVQHNRLDALLGKGVLCLAVGDHHRAAQLHDLFQRGHIHMIGLVVRNDNRPHIPERVRRDLALHEREQTRVKQNLVSTLLYHQTRVNKFVDTHRFPVLPLVNIVKNRWLHHTEDILFILPRIGDGEVPHFYQRQLLSLAVLPGDGLHTTPSTGPPPQSSLFRQFHQ